MHGGGGGAGGADAATTGSGAAGGADLPPHPSAMHAAATLARGITRRY
jgi:hypothetical protein